jgi:hypothetical protein
VKITKDSVLNAVASLMRQRFNVAAERNKSFVWPFPSDVILSGAKDLASNFTVIADLYLQPPLHCLVQFDDPSHCTRERAATFANYPTGTPLNFDVRRYHADQTTGDAAIAQTDVLADQLPPKHGLNPTVRIRFDEIEELTGPLAERIESVLSHRFAYHAGTTFHLMVDNAGAKPHSQIKHDNLSD